MLNVKCHALPPFLMANATKEPHAAQAHTKPAKTFRLRGISASVFANAAKGGDREVPFHKVSLQRTYREDDEWKTTSSFGRDDLPIAKLVLDQAWQFILETEAIRAKGESDE